jgi:peptidyl-prolyl cis-trans isomerase C
MKKTLSLCAILIAMTLSISSALAASTTETKPGRPVVTVNGYPISARVEAALIEEQIARGASDTPELRQSARDKLVRRALLLSEAQKKNLDKMENIKGQMEIAAQLVLIRTYLADYLKNNPVTDAEIQAAYEISMQQLGTLQYKPRHILLDTEEEAMEIIAQLTAGKNFSDLAKVSKDPYSQEKGGDLGWNVPFTFAPSFAEALKQLQKGQYTKTPVKTESGYHVIYLEDIQNLTPPSPEQLKTQLVERVSQQKIEKLIFELLEKAEIKEISD